MQLGAWDRQRCKASSGPHGRRSCFKFNKVGGGKIKGASALRLRSALAILDQIFSFLHPHSLSVGKLRCQGLLKRRMEAL